MSEVTIDAGNDDTPTVVPLGAQSASVVSTDGQVVIGGLDATGVDEGYVPTADGADGWAWAEVGGGPLTGAGFPEGVVAAPVGTEYVDLAATNGAIKWIKASGTGNTGWVVTYGDTGPRNLKSVLDDAGWGGVFTALTLRRVGPFVELSGGRVRKNLNGETFGAFQLLTDPGFNPAAVVEIPVRPHSLLPVGASARFSSGWLEFASLEAYPDATVEWRFSASWQTTDPWPTTLPGTPA